MMLKFMVFVIGLFLVNVNETFAFMPNYPDDAQFSACVRVTGDYEKCSEEQIDRNSKFVREQYETIVSNPNLVGWHDKIAENTATVRDMRDSWRAFKTRLCSLSSKSALYLEKLFDEKKSCNSYYIKHHMDHLDKIIKLLKGNVPANRAEFSYLEIYDHDEEYKECIKRKDASKCLEEEFERSTKQIKNLYKTALEDNMLGKWNNGPDLKNGNYRDMYDSWIAYRNRICSLSVWAYKKGYGDNGVSLVQCLQFFNREKLETMENLLVSAHSALDEEIETDDDDGGEAEGKTIKPLERRFDAVQNKEDVIDTEEKNQFSEKNKQPEQNSPKRNLNIPSWAQ